MTVTADDRPRIPGAPPPDLAPPPRQRRPRRRGGSLPSGRALVGGFLIAVAMVASVAVARSGGEPPTIATVVARGTITPGDALGASNLEVVHLALPDHLADRTFPDVDALVGTVARSHLAPGDVLQQGNVVTSTAAQRASAPARELSIRLDADRAVDGRLEAGDRVDLLATYGSGRDATTHVVLSDAPVLSVDGGDGSTIGGRTVVVTLALEDRASTVAVAHAVDNASVTLVRTTTAGPDGAVEPPYSPAAAARPTDDSSPGAE
ncbi:MAG: RcpC/CpaB family pilus assembly protein [Acidimicrobiales bacterium]